MLFMTTRLRPTAAIDIYMTHKVEGVLHGVVHFKSLFGQTACAFQATGAGERKMQRKKVMVKKEIKIRAGGMYTSLRSFWKVSEPRLCPLKGP